MRTGNLVRQSLRYHWRTNAAVVLGVATAVSVLAGALLVGESVRGSLRDLALRRIGRTDRVVVSTGFFREALAEGLASDAVVDVAPLLALEGVVSSQTTGRRASRVQVYGVDDRFWLFHGVGARRGPAGRDAFISRALAADIGATLDSVALVRLERPSAIPIESLHGRKDDAGRTVRLTVRAIVGADEMGEFSLHPQQGDIRAIFVPLQRAQQDLDLAGRVNTVLVADQPGRSSDLEASIRRRFALEDVGLTVREAGGEIAVESAAGFLDSARAKAIEVASEAASLRARPVLTYLANSIRSADREVPYSLVTAVDLSTIVTAVEATTLDSPPPCVVNEWTAKQLGVTVGDTLTLDYYLWEDPGRLVTHSAELGIAAVVPIEGAAADRNLVPVYPGITNAATLSDWDPPFPIDLKRVRPVDEAYWDKYRTTPKVFVPFEVGRRLWSSRFGDRTSMRVRTPHGEPPEAALERLAASLRDTIDPIALGLSTRDVRVDSLTASRGATDFGEYFTYFSFFLVVSALLLAALFFRLAIEQRAREVGLLRSVGFSTPRVRRLFLVEASVLASIGAMAGAAGAVVYAAAMMYGLRTWWQDAVTTRSLTLHIAPVSLLTGAAAALVAAMLCICWTLRDLSKVTERSLLAGELKLKLKVEAGSRASAVSSVAFITLGVLLIIASTAGVVDRTGAFFGAGSALLIACLCLAASTLRRPAARPIGGNGWPAIVRLGMRNACERPGRSVLVMGVIASATFVLVSVDAFRKDAPSSADRHSGVGGYSLLVNLLLPIASNPNGRDGREAIGLSSIPPEAVTVEPFRLRPGDDASCLNLYEPTSPRILGVRKSFVDRGGFAFQSSIAATDAERANPWLLLNRRIDDETGVVPVVADANSMTYVLHKAIGDDIVFTNGGRRVRLRLVAALDDSIFQSEILMAESNFLRLFPEQEGYQFLLIDTAPDRARSIAAAIEQGAADLGADAVSTSDRLEEFHVVENTYLSTFKMLGGLGLLLGTVGLGATLLRNVLERRRELALLGAVGYRREHIFAMIVAENVLLLGCGLIAGAFCAAVAIAPAALERGGRVPAGGAGMLVAAVFIAGLLSSVIATRAALRSPLLSALRAE